MREAFSIVALVGWSVLAGCVSLVVARAPTLCADGPMWVVAQGGFPWPDGAEDAGVRSTVRIPGLRRPLPHRIHANVIRGGDGVVCGGLGTWLDTRLSPSLERLGLWAPVPGYRVLEWTATGRRIGGLREYTPTRE